MELPIIFFAFPVFILAIVLEYFYNRRKKLGLYQWKDTLVNFGIGIGGQLIRLLPYGAWTALFFHFYYSLSDWRAIHLGYDYLESSWGIWLIAIIADDFSFYWYHRISHRVRILWACHVVHHSSDQYNLSVAVRNGWINVSYKLLFWLWLPIMGFHPAMVASCASINSIYQFFCHTQIRGRWERLSGFLITPGLHAVHHAKNPECIDKNYAGVFSFLDRIFGTFHPYSTNEELQFGVTIPPRSQNLVEIITHEFRNLFQCMGQKGSIREKIHELLRPPR